MTYLEEDRKFVVSYQELREKYLEFVNMTDEEFLSSLPKASHLACIICYFKEVPSYNCIGDTGIIHELIHLMDEGTTTGLEDIRELFNEQLKLH